MKNVISMVVIAVLITFLFCACTAPEEAAAFVAPTEDASYSESETLYYDGFTGFPQELESCYDGNGILTETIKTEYHDNGAVSVRTVTQFDDAGNVIFFQESHSRPDGTTADTLLKYFDASGALTKQEDLFFWENGQLRLSETRHFTASGTLLSLESTGYHADGSLSLQSTEQLVAASNLRRIHRETFHENGHHASFCDGTFHPETYALLNGKIETYNPDGTTIRLETAQLDAETNVKTSSFYCYTDNSSGCLTEYLDEHGRVITRESLTYEKNQVLFEHYIETFTYDFSGNLIHQAAQYYLADSVPGERFETSYAYNEAGAVIREETAQYLADGKRQNLTITEFTYDGDALIKEAQVSYDHKDKRKSSLTTEYDVFGTITSFVTVSSSGNSHTYTYTYNENGQVLSELMVTNYKSAPRIDYQEITYEYHDNGPHSCVAVHKWTSYDEAKFPNADKQDLGQTTVKYYDENGNRI